MFSIVVFYNKIKKNIHNRIRRMRLRTLCLISMGTISLAVIIVGLIFNQLEFALDSTIIINIVALFICICISRIQKKRNKEKYPIIR